MEEMLKQILSELKDVRTEVKDVRTDLKDVRTELKDVRETLKVHGKKLDSLELSTVGIMQESRQIHRALIENKDVRNKEIENLLIDVAEVTGVIKGIRNSVQNFKKAE